MKCSTPFDPRRKLIYVSGLALSERRDLQLRLVVDTGASETTLTPEVIDRLGYRARDGIRPTSVNTAIGKGYGYLLRVRLLSALGVSKEDFAVNVLDISEQSQFDGLLGLSFLRSSNLTVLWDEGVIVTHCTAR